MATGKRTGFQLLSLVSPSPNQAQLHTPCQLPNQLRIYLWGYLPLIVLTLLGLVVLNVHRIRAPWPAAKISRSKTPAVRTKGDTGEGEEEEEEEATVGLTSAPFGREKLEVEVEMHGRRLSVSGPASVSMSMSASASEDEDEDDWGGSNSYGFYENIYEYGNGDGTAGSVHFLPAPISPSSTNHIRQQHQQPSQRADSVFSWTFVLGNQRRRAFLPPISEIPRLLVECAKGRPGRREGRDDGKAEARVGFVQNLVNDVVSVAWPPLGAFIVSAWWMF
jgi:hypothetical protein